MICINCKKTIDRSYGAPDLAGNYCKACAIKLEMGNPPNCGSSVQKREYRKLSKKEEERAKEFIDNIKNTPMQIIPFDNNKTLIPLIEQFNGLLDRYNALYGTFMNYKRFANDSANDRLNKTLENIEEAIAALCLRITEKQCIVTVKE